MATTKGIDTNDYDPTDVLFVRVTSERRAIAEVLAPVLRIDEACGIHWLFKPRSCRAAIMACIFAARAMEIRKLHARADVTLVELYEWLAPMQWAESSIRVNAGKLVDAGYIVRDRRGSFRLVNKQREAAARLIRFFTP